VAFGAAGVPNRTASGVDMFGPSWRAKKGHRVAEFGFHSMADQRDTVDR